jgi:hypothetical protein
MSFTTNVEITKAYPGVLYNASESLMAYHEDHEINGTGAGPFSWTVVDCTSGGLIPPFVLYG